MAWNGQWSITVDGHELNSLQSGGPYTCIIPELTWVFEQTVVLVERDHDYPVAVALQPQAGRYTLLINSTACDWGTWWTRLTQLQGWLTPGAHVIVVQVRGMPNPMTLYGVVSGMMDSPVERRVTATVTVPKPVLV